MAKIKNIANTNKIGSRLYYWIYNLIATKGMIIIAKFHQFDQKNSYHQKRGENSYKMSPNCWKQCSVQIFKKNHNFWTKCHQSVWQNICIFKEKTKDLGMILTVVLSKQLRRWWCCASYVLYLLDKSSTLQPLCNKNNTKNIHFRKWIKKI